jgi:hypothetical protein
MMHPKGTRSGLAAQAATLLAGPRAACCLAILLAPLMATVPVMGATRGLKMPVTPKWGRFEASFKSTLAYSNPVQDASLTVVFTSPLGEVFRLPGFWDGGRTWRVRFSPDLPGHWTFQTLCSDPMNDGLQNQTGEFMCTSTLGQSRFDEHGLVRVARDHHSLQHSDGTPFFWVGDTAWSGARVSRQLDWETYAQIRLAQGFNAIVYAAAPGLDDRGESPTTGFPEQIGINPEYFQRLDAKVSALGNAGLLNAIAPFSDAEWTASGSPVLADSQVALLVRYVVARYGADPVAWVLPIEPEAKGRRNWKELGRQAFGDFWHAPVIIYSLVGGDFELGNSEKWVDVFGFTFGSGVDPEGLRAAFDGPLSKAPKLEPGWPVLVLTPFENAEAGVSKRVTANEVRHAAYWGVMMSGAAGVSYGAFGVSNWQENKGWAGELAGQLPFWRKALFMTGAKQVAQFGKLMNSLPFSSLRPDPSVIAGQPGERSPERRVVSLRSPANDLALVYVPLERSIELVLDALPPTPVVSWFNPRTGDSTPAVAVVSGKTAQFPTPGVGDWLLVAKKGKK